MDLLRNKAAGVAWRSSQRLHHLPGRVVRAARIANFTLLDQSVQSLHCLLDRGQSVPFVQVVDINVVGTQSLERAFALADQVPARCALVVRPRADRHPRLRGDEDIGIATLEDFAQNLFGKSSRVHIGGIEEVDAPLDTAVHQQTRLVQALASGPAKGTASAKGKGAHGKRRDL